ncbi:MAG TPA: ATP-binding protein [Acidobacteriota bacterium]|nr:ATP-binding protein [Acidobacteriota bacterium]
MEISNAIVAAAIIHSLVFLALLGIWFAAWRNRFRLFERPLPKAKSQIEQRMVLEALSACAVERDFNKIIALIGKHAAEMNGFAEWIIWTADSDRCFRVAEYEIDLSPDDEAQLKASKDPMLYGWITQNASPIFLRPFVGGMAGSEPMRRALKRLSNGVLIPFLDGEETAGFVITGGERLLREQRSEQCLSLFGATAAITIKKAQLDERERELMKSRQRSDTLASLGKMAARLAHEIRNPLTFIRSATDCLQSRTLEEHKRETLSAGISEEIDRIDQRIEELLSLGRIDPDNFVKVDLYEVIRKTVSLAETSAREKGIAIEIRFDADTAFVNGDADRLWQLFENLVINSIQAIDGSGRITIEGSSAGHFVAIDVADNGGGIEAGTAARIFDPFFSTKKKGSGLGLAIVYSIAKAHGGTVELASTSTEGSCFRVTLPLIG